MEHSSIGHLVPKSIKGLNQSQLTSGIIGSLIGTLVAGIILGYEHWRKEESQKIAVQEMNTDMANTIAIQPTDKELVSENKRLRSMLEELEQKKPAYQAIAEQEPKHAHESILQHGQKSHHEHAEQHVEHSRA